MYVYHSGLKQNKKKLKNKKNRAELDEDLVKNIVSWATLNQKGEDTSVHMKVFRVMHCTTEKKGEADHVLKRHKIHSA